jgi:hypothetical protein
VSSEKQLGLSKTQLKYYWLIDQSGSPVGKPFVRRADINLYQAQYPNEDYTIVALRRGRPRQHQSDRDRKAAYDRKRDRTPERKAYKAALARKKRREA